MEGKINGCESFRDASFSYLRSDQKPTTSARTIKATNVVEAEISVFGAERYFNTPIQTLHSTNSNSDRRRESQGVAGEYIGDDSASVATARPGTPSACSDGSRSTAMLLKSGSAALRRSLSSSQRNHRRRRRQWLLEGSRSFFSALGWCTGTCTDKTPVFVADSQGQSLGQDQNHHHQSHRFSFRYEARSTKRAEDHFAFPILNATAEESKKPLPPPDDPPRMSLEVFGSKAVPLGVVDEVAKHLERKLSVLTWDAIPASVPHKPSGYLGGSRVSPKTSRGGGGDDIDSDASSDLFEIENITANRKAHENFVEPAAVVSARNSGYEPSEASFDWSVVTASAAADVAGPEQYDEKKIAAKVAKSRPGIGILGCKSQRSVRVAENASRTTVSSKEDS